MSAALLLAFAGFAFTNSITPGPNNTMLLASGVNYGFWRTLPHMLGITLGCVAMLILVGLGLGQVFVAVPVLYRLLRYVGAAYLLWLAWKIARAGPLSGHGSVGRPMTFLQAAAFQWLNPKAWVIIVGAVSTYVPLDAFARNVVVAGVLMMIVMLPSNAIWAGFGRGLRAVLSDPAQARVFNVGMAMLLVLSLIPILGED